MNFKEFKQEVLSISKTPFVSAGFDPLAFGIERALFEEKKLRRLLEVAQQVDFLTAKRKADGWQRQLQKVQQRRERLQNVQRSLHEAPARSTV